MLKKMKVLTPPMTNKNDGCYISHLHDFKNKMIVKQCFHTEHAENMTGVLPSQWL